MKAPALLSNNERTLLAAYRQLVNSDQRIALRLVTALAAVPAPKQGGAK